MSDISPTSTNVDRLEYLGKEIFLVGTAHISQASVELAEQTIRELRPDLVAVELCASRFKSLRDPDRWKRTDIFQVFREQRQYVLLAQLLLASFQKKLGKQLNIQPGAEMLRAVAVAEELGIPILLADREIRVTLKRTWNSLGLWTMAKLVVSLVRGAITREEITAQEIERLKSADALEEVMREFSARLPNVRTALIDERDLFLAAKIRDGAGKRIVAVVGAGHVPGIKRCLHEAIDIALLETLPKASRLRAVLGWGIPLLFFLLITWAFFGVGYQRGVDLLGTWVLISAAAGAIGGALCAAHPLAILGGALSAPIMTLHPLLAPGWVAGIIEAFFHKPTVADFESITDDLQSFRGFFRNRVMKILVVTASVNVCARVGALLALGKLAQLLGSG